MSKKTFSSKTKELWSRYYGRPISKQEAEEIRKNVSGLIGILREINSDSEERES